MLADGAQHDDAHARILVERLEHQAQLIALPHLDDVERRPVEHDVGALARGVDLDAKAVEFLVLQTRIGKRGHAAVPCWRAAGWQVRSTGTYSPATSLRRKQLADRRFRNLGDEDVAARPFEAGEAGRAAERVELVGLDRGAALDEGGDDLAPALVRQADHRDLGHARVQRQAGFDLDRRNVLAAGDDHVVDAAGDEDVAVGVDEAGVAGEIPALRAAPWRRLPAAASSPRTIHRRPGAR